MTLQTIADLARLFIETEEHPGGDPCARGDPYCLCSEEEDPDTGEPVEICLTEAYSTYQRRDSAAVYALLGLTDEQTRQLLVMAAVDLTAACAGSVPNPASPYTWGVRHLRITSCFGPRADPLTGAPQFHYGIDLEAVPGDPVLAATAGTVHLADWAGDYGNLVILISPDGLHTWYGHLSGYVVSQGEAVTQGQPIGYVGNTGKSSGPHLHFETRPAGNPVNPQTYYR